MDDESLVRWSATDATWSPEGYRVRVVVNVYDRAAHELERQLPAALQELDADQEIGIADFIAGTITRSRAGSSAQPTSFALVGDRSIFAIPPVAFADWLEQLARDVQADSDEQDARDLRLAHAWLCELHQRASERPV